MKPKSQTKAADCSSAIDDLLKTLDEILAFINAYYSKFNHIKKRKRTIKADVS